MSKKTFCDQEYECVNCSQPLSIDKILMCGKCHKTIYCSKPCQIYHWKTDHKVFCKKDTKDMECSHFGTDEFNCTKCHILCCNKCHQSHIKKFHPEAIDKCVICYDSIVSSDLMTTECCHQFHNECIKKIKDTTNKCPICRIDLSLDVKSIIKEIIKISKMQIDTENNKILIKKLIKSLNDLVDRNNPDALFSFGMLYSNGIVVEKDYKIAFNYFYKAA